MKKWIERVFHIREGEFALVQAFFLFFAGIGMLYTVGATVGDTLFLANLPPERVPTMLPLVYAGIAGASFLATMIYDQLSSRVSRMTAIVGTQLALAVSVLLFRAALGLEARWVYLALVIWMEVAALLSITLFFSFAGDYFNSRDARRLYGFIVGGMALGTVVAGNSISATVLFLGTRNLLYVCAALLALNAFICWRIHSFATPVPAEEDLSAPTDGPVRLKSIFDRPYVRLLALVVVLSLVMSVVVDYQMKWIASTMDEERLARFFGSFWGAVGIAQLLFQFLLVPRLLRTLGIINCLMILPALIALVGAALLASVPFEYFGLNLLMFAAAANFLRITLTETLDLPSREMLFLPLPTRIRLRAQPFMNGGLAALARGLGGMVLLLLYTLGVGVDHVTWVSLLCGLLLVLSLMRLRPRYRDTLAATLRSQEMAAADLQEVVQSPAVDPVLEELLRADDPEVIRFTLGLIQGREVGGLAPVLEELLGRDDPQVSVAVLRCLGGDPRAEFVPLIRGAIFAERPEVREAAVLAMCQANPEASDEVFDLLRSDDERLREAAIVGLGRYGGDEGRELVLPLLEKEAQSSDQQARMRAARLLAEIGRSGYAELLERLLTDGEQQVRREAIAAVADAREGSLIPKLIGAMDEADLQPLVVHALGSMPPEGVVQLASRIGDESCPPGERRLLMHAVSRVGGPPAASLLWDQVLRSASNLLHGHAAAAALRALRKREGLYNLRLKGYRELLERLYASLELLNRAADEVGADDPFTAGVFRDEARLTIEMILSLLALKHDPHQIGRILFNLFSESPATRARSLELLDELLPRPLALRALPLMQPAVEGREPTGTGLTERTKADLLGASVWLRAVTTHHLSGVAPDPGGTRGISLFLEERQMYSRLEKISFLKNVDLFSGVPAAFLLEQCDIAEWQSLDADEVLFEQGDPGDALYLVAEGEVRILVGGVEVATLGPGQCLGEMALLDDEPRSATVQGATGGRMLRLGADRFTRLLSTQPPVAKALLGTLDERIRKTQASGGGAPVDDPADEGIGHRLTRAGSLDASNLQHIIPILSFFERVDLFKGLPLKSLTRLAGIVEEVSFDAGEELFAQGDVGDSLYLICSGAIDIVVGGNTVATLGADTCLGEMALIGDATRSAAARVAEDARLYRLWADDFDQLLATEPDVSLGLLRTLAQRLRRASQAGGKS